MSTATRQSIGHVERGPGVAEGLGVGADRGERLIERAGEG
jgi:hypothetical protein